MPEMFDSEQAIRYARAYTSRRWPKSTKFRTAWWGEAGSGSVTGLIGFLASPAWNVVAGIACGLAGGAIWHYIVHPAIRYIWVVPVEEHIDQQLKIHELETESRNLHREIETLQAQSTVHPRSIAIESGGFTVAVNDPDQTVTLPGLWVMCYDVVITNCTERQIPVEMWIYIGMREDGSWRVGELCRTSLPAWAVDDTRARDSLPFERVVNLPALAGQDGFCAVRFSRDVLTWARVSSVDALGRERPFWLEVKNKLTKESTTRALNAIAARVDIRNS